MLFASADPMLVPIRCFTCNTPVGHVYPELTERQRRGHTFDAVMSDCGIRRYCCKRMLVTHVDLGRLVAEYDFREWTDGLSKFQCVASAPREVSCE